MVISGFFVYLHKIIYMVLLNNEIKKEKTDWNLHPSVSDYLSLTNHGVINNSDHFPWKGIIFGIIHNNKESLSDRDRYNITNNYEEIVMFADYYHIPCYLSKEKVSSYNRHIHDMLNEISNVESLFSNSRISIYILILIHIIYLAIFAVLYYSTDKHYLLCLIAYPLTWILSWYLTAIIDYKKEKKMINTIELTYFQLLVSFGVDSFLDEIFKHVKQSCSNNSNLDEL